MNRRDLLIGAGCFGALGAAEALRPRTPLRLMPQQALADVIPRSFGEWQVQDGGMIVTPDTPNSLADRLYSDSVAHSYVHHGGGPLVMLLAAYGDSQSDLLQLHRPEACYPAVGFELLDRQRSAVPLIAGTTLPAVEIVARAGDRFEDVLYWTRLGEYLPTSSSEQMRDRLATSMKGYIADGVLVRASIARSGSRPADFTPLKAFVADLLHAVPSTARPGLIGTELSRRLA